VLTQTGDTSNTLFSDRYQQTYHSTFGALTESTHVFLHGSGVYNRLREKHPTRVLEIGFGLGLNFLVCADCAHTRQTRLTYTGIEHAPVNSATMRELNYAYWLRTPKLAHNLIGLFSTLSPDSEHCVDSFLSDHCQLRLKIGDATSSCLLNQLEHEVKFDAIFLDAFSPDTNPECWTQAFFEQLRHLLAPSGRLATYCVKGLVRRNLAAAGFLVHKYPGPIGKREVLWASLDRTE